MAHIDIEQTDFIERMKEATRLKWTVYLNNPAIFQFASMFFTSDMSEVPERLKEQYSKMQENGYAFMYKGIDYSLFREDVSSEKLFHIIQYFLAGYEERLRMEVKRKMIELSDFDAYVEEFFEYLDILKVTFYKEEKQ
ncbi:hypothetical protein U0355_12200 [Salimicrobium sp. PL1-032A]|uniref:hypothetical protein n=1 Tax=Salimicrobium sp. PL1-032A TaxID=3095364 RepID=UPI00325FF8B1